MLWFQVKKNDQMPQNICTLCADKINDIYEYREMCTATNIQTRKLLGLPEISKLTSSVGRKRKKGVIFCIIKKKVRQLISILIQRSNLRKAF